MNITHHSNTKSLTVKNKMPNLQQGSATNVSITLAQQRQILSLMGIDIWMQRDAPTELVNYEELSIQARNLIETQPILFNSTSQQSKNTNPAYSDADTNTNDGNANDAYKAETLDSSSPVSAISSTATNQKVIDTNDRVVSNLEPSGYHNQSLDSSETTEIKAKGQLAEDDPLLHFNVEKPANARSDSNLTSPTTDSSDQSGLVKNTDQGQKIDSVIKRTIEQVESFEVVGAPYHGWVLIVDVKLLNDELSLKLWENIITALSLKPQPLKFPICEGISDKESANASIAGFIFSLTKSDTVKIANLTPMPTGTSHERMVTVPSLTQMIEDSQQKKVLWDLLNLDQSISQAH